MNFAGLLFDMDDVLYDDTIWCRWLHRLLCRMGFRPDYHSFFHDWQHEYLALVNQGNCDYQDALKMFLMSVGLTIGQTDEVLAASHSRRRDSLENIRPLPGVRSTTNRLAAMGVPLGILCNSPWPGAQLEKMLRRLGLTGRFQPVLSSYDLGCTMPSHECYQAAHAAMHFDASQIAFVGHDSIELAGAKAAGMTTFAFNHGDDAKADVYLQQFDELLSFVDCRSSRKLAS